MSLAAHGFSWTCHKTGTTSGLSLRWIYLLSQSLPVDQGKALPPQMVHLWINGISHYTPFSGVVLFLYIYI